MIELHGGDGRTRLRLRALHMGEDICILLDGGHRPHVGAAALASPGAPAPTLTLPGHREDELARRLAQELSAALNAAVAVVCGIHITDVTQDEIAQVYETAFTLARELSGRLRKSGAADVVARC